MTRTSSRRALLQISGLSGAALVAALASGLGRAQRALAAVGGPILKPLPLDRFVVFGTNAEMRWGSVGPAEHLTRQADLFVRNHTVTPMIDPSTYALQVFGDGLEKPREAAGALALSLDDLRCLPQTKLTTVHECTGNGRRFFETQQGTRTTGTAWGLGAVGTVRWEGVRLREVLDLVGVDPAAVSVQATGLDPSFVSGGVDHGRVRRPFPIAKAYDDALLAWAANDEPLLPDHGFPLRLVLPGWVGIASIKWLGSLEVSRTELTSPWSTRWYRLTGGDHPADASPLTVNPVRSAWELPWPATVERRRKVHLTGRSWSGAGPIRGVEVSLDGGATWQAARLHRAGLPGWTQWSVDWLDPRPGRHELLARATDVLGRTQPDVAAYNENGYFFDAVVRHPVTVV